MLVQARRVVGFVAPRGFHVFFCFSHGTVDGYVFGERVFFLGEKKRKDHILDTCMVYVPKLNYVEFGWFSFQETIIYRNVSGTPPALGCFNQTPPPKKTKKRNEASQKVKATSGNQRVQKIIDPWSL